MLKIFSCLALLLLSLQVDSSAFYIRQIGSKTSATAAHRSKIIDSGRGTWHINCRPDIRYSGVATRYLLMTIAASAISSYFCGLMPSGKGASSSTCWPP